MKTMMMVVVAVDVADDGIVSTSKAVAVMMARIEMPYSFWV